MLKRIVTMLAAVALLVGAGLAAAQSRGGGGGMHGGAGGGSWGGSGGGWHGGGGSWSGGGGSWSGGGSWHGGSNWNGGGSWHGGGWNNGWNNGWRGGCWNCGWRGGWWGGTNVGFYFGFPGTWWWPAPAWGWGWGWPASSVQVVGAPTFVDQGQVVFIQRDQVVDGAYTSAAPARAAPANEFWHYCIDPPGYFPTVQQCNREWLKVVPNVNSRPAQPPQYQ